MIHESTTVTATPQKRVPGETGVWVFIFGDMTLFAYVFVVYLHYRALDVEVFRSSQALLNQGFGVAYTLILLSSSLLVVIGQGGLRGGQRDIAWRCYAAAMGCGLAFVSLKVAEYQIEISDGRTMSTNRFFTFYYLLTGLHLLHLILGMAVLAYLFRISRRPALTRGQIIVLEGGSCYWHMVDLLWILIFPLLYLIR